jgi:hypothetical protein
MEFIPDDATHLIMVREGSRGRNWTLYLSANESDVEGKRRLARSRGLDVIVTQIVSRDETEYDPR